MSVKYLDDQRNKLGTQPLRTPLRAQTQALEKTATQGAEKGKATPAAAQTYSAAQPAETTRTAPAPAQTTTTAPAVQTQQNDVVAQAQQLISQQLQNFQGSNAGAINDLMAQLQNREAFSYDVNTDPTYLMLRDIWSQDGRLAMEDTMGQVAQLTGGYGNSYAQMAGQQTYQNYMRGLNEMVPDLKEAARADYDAETNDLLQRLALLREQDEQEYSRYMDFLAQQYQEGRDAVSDQRYDQEWQYQQEQDALANERYDQEWAYQQEQDERDYMLNLALAAYEMGDDSLVKELGINPQEYGVSYGSYSSDGYRTSDKKTADDDETNDKPVDQNPDGSNVKTPWELGNPLQKEDYTTVYADCAVLVGNGASTSEVTAYIKSALSDGIITQEQYKTLMAKYGNLAEAGDSSGGKNSGGGGGKSWNNRYDRMN